MIGTVTAGYWPAFEVLARLAARSVALQAARSRKRTYWVAISTMIEDE